MENIKTTNIISTPEITGNIGSCTTQVAEVTSQRLSFYKVEKTAIATNSCTGEVTHYKTWEFSDAVFFSGTFALFVVILMCLAIGTSGDYKGY